MPLLGQQKEGQLLRVRKCCKNSDKSHTHFLPEDARLGEELASSEKDRSEHIMLVDLARNDVNRVCQAKTVKVDHLMQLEKFSHVIHLTSQVSGLLRDGLTRSAVFIIHNTVF